MKEIPNEMTRAEMAEEFRLMAHNFFRMNELPHEEAARMIGLIAKTDPNAQEWANAYISHVSGVLLRLSNEVTKAGQEALRVSRVLHQSEKSERDTQDTAGR